MFGNHRDDLAATMRQMQQEALEKSNYSQSAARAELVRMVQNDRRLDGYDPEALVDHVRSYAESGRSMDWDSPAIKKGGGPRPGAGELLRKGRW